MAAFANLTINDGQTTPAAHTFTVGPKTVLPDGTTRYTWFDFGVNGGVPIGANRLDLDVRMPTYKNGTKSAAKAGDASQVMSVAYKFTLPTLETLSNNTSSGIQPQPTHAYDTTIWSKLVRNGRCPVGPVNDAVAFSRNFAVLAVYTDAVRNYSPPSV